MPRLILMFVALLAYGGLLLPLANADDQQAKQAEPITPDKPIDLFNGKDLSNWTYDLGGKNTDPADVYRVEEGIIQNAGRPRA